jgi:acyl-CoA dehydrogenase
MNEVRDMIEQSVTRLFAQTFTPSELARFDREGPSDAAWRACVELGFDRALLTEAHGGIGATPEDVLPIARAAGYYAAGIPLADSMTASWLLAMAGIAPPAGAGVLIDDTGSAAPLVFERSGRQRRIIAGEVRRVCWAGNADWGVAAHSHDGIWEVCLIALDAASGVKKEMRQSVAAEPAADLTFKDVAVLAAGSLAPDVNMNPVRLAGALARSAQMCGALERVLDLAVQYATERVQFGKPIGQNQAIQQMLALLAGHVAAARVATLVAWSGGANSVFDISVAKVRCSEAAGFAASVAHQVHGAIGFTHEHTLHFFTRRLWSWRTEFGSDAWWSAQLGHDAIMAGKKDFWGALVARKWHVD